MMKRMMAAIAFLGVSMASFAQETVPVQKYSVATNSFWSNWFIQIGGDYNAWYSNQEHGLGLDNGKHYSLFNVGRCKDNLFFHYEVIFYTF